jgi:hypothetical protein
MRRSAALALLCFALTPAAAHASSASLDGSVLRYHAASGEHNALELRVGPGATTALSIRMTDPGANVEAGANCSSIDPHTVVCPVAGSVTSVDIDLGDEDDSYTGSGAPITFGGGPIQGGSGNDRISVAPNAYERSMGFVNAGSDGGPGNDELSGVEGTTASTAVLATMSSRAEAETTGFSVGRGATGSWPGRAPTA